MTKRNINISILLLALLIGIGIGILGIAKASGLLAQVNPGVTDRVAVGTVLRVAPLSNLHAANLTLGGLAVNSVSLKLDGDDVLNGLDNQLLS